MDTVFHKGKIVQVKKKISPGKHDLNVVRENDKESSRNFTNTHKNMIYFYKLIHLVLIFITETLPCRQYSGRYLQKYPTRKNTATSEQRT